MQAQDYLIDGVGLWAEVRQGRPAGGPLLLLDRDGVVNADYGYVGDPDRVVLVPGIALAVARCGRAGIATAIVTNQSGIARGLFGWDDFRAVQHRIDALLAREGAAVDAVFACAYHASGSPGLDVADHPWRKPRPGMLNAALEAFGGDRGASGMIGDNLSDMQAAAAAGVRHRFLLGDAAPPVPAGVTAVASVTEAVDLFLGAVTGSSDVAASSVHPEGN